MKNFTFSFTDIDTLRKVIDKDVIDTQNTLVQVFCAKTDVKYIKDIQAYFQKEFPLCILVGTTTDGIIDGENVYADTKSVVSFTIFSKTTLKSTLLEHSHHFNDSYETGQKLAQELISSDTKVIISFADGINTNGEEYAKGIASISKDVILSGGLAADNGKVVKTYIFNKKKVISRGAIGVSLNSKVLSVTTNYTFDWMPIGKEMSVTKSVKNRVYEIDGVSAVNIYAKYMGQELASKLPQVGIEFPLIFERAGVSVGRAVLHKHEDGSLTFAGNIDEGDSVRFGVGSIETILKNSDYHTRKMLEKMKYKTEALFVYSCMARRRFMNEYIGDELKMLSHLGDVSGFFTYGEFYHAEGCNQLLNETMTILALSEDEESISDTFDFEEKVAPQNFGVDSNHVIAHLANTVSSELEELNQNLEKRIAESSNFIYKQAYYDNLTGLPNRLSLIKRLTDSFGKILILINIDDFTTINDFYGHEVGDKVLKQLSSILQALTSNETAEVFKLPSDEFAIVMEVPYKSSSIEERIKRCILSIANEEFLVSDGHFAHVSVTISAALINEKKTGLVNADMTLKLAKRAGKEYMIFNEDLELAKQYEDNIKIANTIKLAINSDNIIPYFQPIVDIKSGKIVKYEALVRLKTEDGILSPLHFLEASQKIKLYPKITKIMVEKSFSYFAKNGLDFSINLSFTDILNEKTRLYLFSKIIEYKIASQLTIEILETQENDNSMVVNAFIENVYKSGARIAIDDFGAGFANFEHMTTMRSDIMKIDGSLIKNIDKDKNARLVVETIVVFARKLNKKVVAEFVHSKEVYDVVKELDIDYVQGYYLGKPQAEAVTL